MSQKNREPGFYWVRIDLHDEWSVAEWKEEPFMRPCWFLIDYEGDCYDDELFEIDERRVVREEPSDPNVIKELEKMIEKHCMDGEISVNKARLMMRAIRK